MRQPFCASCGDSSLRWEFGKDIWRLSTNPCHVNGLFLSSSGKIVRSCKPPCHQWDKKLIRHADCTRGSLRHWGGAPDVVALGSGAVGLCAALAASVGGADALVQP